MWHKIYTYTIMLSNFLKVLCRKNPNENFLRTLFDGPSLDRVPALVHGKQHKKQMLKHTLP